MLEAISDTGVGSQLRIMSLNDDRRLALVEKANAPFSLEVDVPDARSLDLGVGFSASDGTAAGPITAVITCQTASGKVELRKDFDLTSDGARWHEMQLDLASVAGNRGTLTLTLLCPGLSSDSSVVAGWSSFQFVSNYCTAQKMENNRESVTKRQPEPYADPGIGQGYRVDLGGKPGALSLRLTSDASEVPLEIVRDNGTKLMRWVGFPAHMHSRSMLVDLGMEDGNSVVLRSDSAFCLEEAKIVQAVEDYVDYDLIYDGDMRVYENFAATAKAICIDRQAVPLGDPVLQFASLGDFASFRCGKSQIIDYQPERIVIDASTDRDCYLLLQDTYYPGWTAYVDGSETEILRTDLGSRAIELGAGKHVVVFEFKPGSVILGLLLSCAGIALAAIYGVWGSRVSPHNRSRRV